MDADHACLWCGYNGCGVCMTPPNYSDNVVSIFDGAPVLGTLEEHEVILSREPDAQFLEHLADEIREGKFVGFAITLGVPSQDHNGAILAMATSVSRDAHNNVFQFLGGIDKLRQEIHEYIRDVSDEYED